MSAKQRALFCLTIFGVALVSVIQYGMTADAIAAFFGLLNLVFFVVLGLMLLLKVVGRVLLWYANKDAKRAKEVLANPMKGRCPDCHHIQVVPEAVSTYNCEQCHAKLRHPTGPAEDTREWLDRIKKR
jgi:ribosomal protein S27E